MRILKRRKSHDDEAGVDMTPMLDIVFIMLIFFIVTAVFLDETGLDFQTPPDCQDCPAPTKQSIQIYLDAENKVSVDRVPIRLEGVSSRVERLLADKPDASILVLASRQASLDPLVYIKDQMNQANRPSVVKMVP